MARHRVSHSPERDRAQGLGSGLARNFEEGVGFTIFENLKMEKFGALDTKYHEINFSNSDTTKSIFQSETNSLPLPEI